MHRLNFNIRSHRARRPGFTLVELLVVITIMGMLMAMIFPAFEQVRETVNKTRCNNNLSGLAKAMQTIEHTSGFPGLVQESRAAGPNGKPLKITWATKMLHALGEEPIYNSWIDVKLKDGQARAQVSNISKFVCSSDPPQGSPMQPLSYVVNAGSTKEGTAPVANIKTYGGGVFFNRYDPAGTAKQMPKNVSRKSLLNGENYTLMMSENVQAHQWADNRTSASTPLAYDEGKSNAQEAQQYTGFVRDGYRINRGQNQDDQISSMDKAPDQKWARPSSNHPEGVHVAFVSGTVRWMADGVEPYIFERLCCSDINALLAPGKGGSLANPDAKRYSPKDGDF